MRLTTRGAWLLVLVLAQSQVDEANAQFPNPLDVIPGGDGRSLGERIGDGSKGPQIFQEPTESLSTNFPIEVHTEGKIDVTFTNDAPYGVDFFLNGSGPLSRSLRLERGQSTTFGLDLASGFSPYVRIRQPNGSYQDFSLPLRNQRYRFRRTPQNQVVNAFE